MLEGRQCRSSGLMTKKVFIGVIDGKYQSTYLRPGHHILRKLENPITPILQANWKAEYSAPNPQSEPCVTMTENGTLRCAFQSSGHSLFGL